MKTFLLKLALIVLPVAALVGSVNYFVDPANIFSGGTFEKEMADIVVRGENAMANFTDYDERLFQKYCIEQRPLQDEIVIVGSSRVMQIGNGAFPSRKVINNGVSRAVLEDYIGILGLYKKHGAYPRRLVIGIDPWVFSGNHGQIRWMTFKEEVERYNRNAGLATRGGLGAWPGLAALGRYEEILSPAYFQQSAKLALKKLKKGKSRTEKRVIATRALEDPENNVRLADGSYSYSLKYKGKTRDEIARDVVSSAAQPLNACEEVDRNLQRRFEQLVKTLVADGSEVVIFLSPYHPQLYGLLTANPRYRAVQEIETMLRQFGAEQRIPVVGSYDPQRLGFTENDFYDGLHPKREAINRFFVASRPMKD